MPEDPQELDPASPLDPPTPPETASDLAPASRGRGGRRWPRRFLRVVLGLLVLGIVVGGLTAAALLGVKSDLDHGRTQLQEGKRDLTSGDLGHATDAFNQAQAAFDGAATHLGGGLAGIMRHVPILGRNLDVARGAAIAGRELASAGAELTGAVDALPEGLGSLAPSQGRLPIAVIASLSDDVKLASQHADSALASIEATPSSLLAGPLAQARFEAVDQVSQAATTLRAASQLFDAFGSFAGADAPRHYLVVAESPAELRGTGGIWGALAVMTMREGGISFSPFRGFLTLPKLKRGTVPAPSADYERNYGSYDAPANWTDMNMTPDFPSAAQAALAHYRVATGQSLDGVISADPFALQDLFRVTGPAKVPGLHVTIRPSNIVDVTTNTAYILLAEEGKVRKEILGDVVGAAFETFLQHGGESLQKLTALAHATSGGHLKVYTVDPAFEQGLRTAGLDGALRAGPGDDLLSVVINSRSGSKVDYYVTRTVDYDVQLGGKGAAFATTAIQLRNDAPRTPLPGFVIQPAVPGYHSGDDVALISTSCPGPCGLVSAQRNGADQGMRVGSELGYPWYQDFFTIPAGTTGTLKVVTSRQGVWQGNSSGGTYTLNVLPQTTAKPTTVRITVHAPAGTRIAWTSEPMQIDGGTASWTGQPQGPFTLEVRFGAPVPLSWMRDAGRLLP